MQRHKKVDKILLVDICLLVICGVVIFFSASLGLLAREGARFASVASSQIGLGIILGGIVAILFSNINYKKLGKYSFVIWITAIILTLAVFIPGLGFEHGGAKRWISLGSVTFQPAEFLKIAYIIYLSAWFTSVKKDIRTFKLGLMPFLIISGISVGVLLIQPDTGTLLLMLSAGILLYFVAGAKLKHIFFIIIIGAMGIALLLFTRPYLLTRVSTFMDSGSDSLGSGYQIQQSLIAIGSGGIVGKGFGQSVQKFNYLPEPIGDSIFAVASEEFGFLGALVLITLFIIFLIRSTQLSLKSKDTFGGLVMLGLAILITTQSFFNMVAMLGIVPLSGIPLIFVSHGGPDMFFALLSVGIMLNISRSIKN